MKEILIQADRQVLYFINQSCSNAFFDFLMPWVRDKFHWIPVYFILVIWIVLKNKKDSWWIILCIAAAVGLADQIASGLFKPMVQRLRPCQAPGVVEHLRMVIPCGGGFSFLSSHAATHFALSLSLIFFLHPARWLSVLFILWAVVVSYAQIYVGYHYPSDVLGGILVGSICAISIHRLSMKKKIRNCTPSKSL